MTLDESVVRHVAIIAAALSILTTAASAEIVIQGPIPLLNYRVVDGDTIAADIEAWPGITIHEKRIRLRNIDTPEIFSPKCPQERERGMAAKEALEAFLQGKSVAIIEISPDDKYGGIVADVTADGARVTEYLVNAGLAARWLPRGKKPQWCAADTSH